MLSISGVSLFSSKADLYCLPFDVVICKRYFLFTGKFSELKLYMPDLPSVRLY